MVKSETKGVSVAAGNSYMSISIERTTGPPGTIEISGLLVDSNGAVIEGVPVKLNITGLDKATMTTHVWATIPVPMNIKFDYAFAEGSYDIYVYWGGNATYLGCDSNLIRATYAKVPTALSIIVSPITGKPPLAVTVSGILTYGAGGGLGNKPVDIYRNDTKIATVTSKPSLGAGYYEYHDTISSAGYYNYYAQFSGDDTYAGCEEEPEACECLPCPACGHPVGIRAVGVEVSCGFCGATSEIVVNG